MISKSILSVVLILSIAGCTRMMPYKDEFKCQKGKNNGICASVSELYEASGDMDSFKKKSYFGKTNSFNSGVSGKKCRLNDCDKAKIALARQRGILMSSLREKEELINVIHALSLENIDTEEYVADEQFSTQLTNGYQVQNTCMTVGSGNYSDIDINSMVEVITSYANIRGEPRCGGRIINVAKKGDQFYIVGKDHGWYELEDGRYIHRSVVKKVD